MKWLIDLLAVGLRIQIDLRLGLDQEDDDDKSHVVACDYCDWKRAYSNADSARRGLRAHEQHCNEYAAAIHRIAGAQHDESRRNGRESHDG